jgi:hypothetical protein
METPGAPPIMGAQFDCNRQGIHVGWIDIYSRSLQCQYIDITDVPAGTYQLRVRVNNERRVRETNYDDNQVTVNVTIPAPPDGGGCAPPMPVAACSSAMMGPDRDCGWRDSGVVTCTAGMMTTLGCDTTCAPPIGGACTGDTMLRVCNGDLAPEACTSTVAIASNDDSGCGMSLCSRVSFMCPASGRVRVLTGAYNSANTASVMCPLM